MITRYGVFCNNCGKKRPSLEAALSQGEKLAVYDGWLHRSLGDIDLCPKCRVQTAEKEKGEA